MIMLALSTLIPFLAAAAPTALRPEVLEQELPLLTRDDTFGLGAEASRALSWIGKNRAVEIENSGAGYRLSRATDSFSLSHALGEAIARMNDYMALTDAGPVSRDELRNAVLAPDGVAQIQGLFDQMIAERVEFAGKTHIPEIGGEATLEPALRLRRFEDSLRPLYRKIAAAADDPAALRILYAQHEKEMKLVDEHLILRSILDRMQEWERRGSPAKTDHKQIYRQAIARVLENNAESYTVTPETQLAAIISQDWTGEKHIGVWHLHPPEVTPSDLRERNEYGPSPNDIEIAKGSGQNLTIIYQDGGFDAWSLPDKTLFTYRDESWRRHFAEIFSRLAKPAAK